MTNQSKSQGYVVVASKKISFYHAAINLIESIKDYYPEANCCLFTEDRFLDGREKIADHVISCDNNNRAKVLGMAKSPYDVTFYIDADTECVHEDIKTIFDQLDTTKYDLMFTSLTEDREYCYYGRKFGKVEFVLGGAVCLYNSKDPFVIEFMQEWYDLYNKHHHEKYWLDKNEQWTQDVSAWDNVNYPYKNLSQWDQFSLWWLVNKHEKFSKIRVGILDDDARWNYYSKYRDSLKHNKKPIVIRHYSSGLNKV